MSWTSSTTGGRIGQLLDAIDFNDRTLWQGGIQADGSRLSGALDTGDTITIGNADGTKSALSIIQDLLEAERGVFYISKDGKATYEERSSRARRRTSSATLTTYALTSQPGFELDNLVNRQAVTRQYQTPGTAAVSPNVLLNGTTQVAKNDVSVGLFGVMDGQDIQTEYVASDAQALNLAQFIVNLRSSFVAPLTIEMDGGPAAAVTQMLSLELQDRVTISDANAGTSGDYIIEGIEVEIADGGNRFVTTFTLSEYGTLPFVFASAGPPTDTATTAPQAVFAPPDGTVTYTVCTNASRPSSPTNGDFILESDTGRYYKRVAGAWVEQIYPRLTY